MDTKRADTKLLSTGSNPETYFRVRGRLRVENFRRDPRRENMKDMFGSQQVRYYIVCFQRRVIHVRRF